MSRWRVRNVVSLFEPARLPGRQTSKLVEFAVIAQARGLPVTRGCP